MKFMILLVCFFSGFTQSTGDRKSVEIIDGLMMDFIFIGPGEFMMGSPESEEGRKPERERMHRVKISKGFWMAKTEMTQEIWEAVMGSNPSKIIGDKHPVESVTYYEILEFISKICSKESSFRLPFEAEWEYACRAGTMGPYAGNRDEMTWHRNNAGKTTHPVASKKPNAWGLYDMHGNVGEACQDWLLDHLVDAIDPRGPETGEYKVIRGGQYTGRVRHTRSADRQILPLKKKFFFSGFRLVME